MQTALIDSIRNTVPGQEADAILRACVHCGFCNATCPTYQILGDELDGPRGRIYLIKRMLEGAEITQHTLTHLDRCLTCRNCETTCPSGVQYGRLVDIGRGIAEQKVTRRWPDKLSRWLLRNIIPYPARFTPFLRLGQFLRPLLPAALRRHVPVYQAAKPWPANQHVRKMLVLEGCAQASMAPNINAACARVLDKLGISLLRAPAAVCCGAASHHTSGGDAALDFARKNIDAWLPYIEAGCEAIVMTASGCGVHVKEYGHLLQADPVYAAPAQKISALTRDLSEVLAQEDLSPFKKQAQKNIKIAFHSPCTLQHGQKLNGAVEKILRELGFTLTAVKDVHLCCGSAGTYSILQKDLSQQLLKNKISVLQGGQPDVIASANIGCLAHLQGAASVPVRHWIEIVDNLS